MVRNMLRIIRETIMRLQFLVTLIVGVAAVTCTCQADPSQDTGKLLLEEAKSLRKEARSRPDLLKAEAKFKEAIVVFDAANEQQSKAEAMRERHTCLQISETA